MKVYRYTGEFAGDKDAAARLRDEYILPSLRAGKSALLDFEKVDLATQSFVHALIAAVVREDASRLERMEFVHCNDSIRSLIEIVTEYAQDEFE